MFRLLFMRVIAAAKNAIVGYTGHILLENSDVLAAENGDQLTAEGG